MSGGQKIVFRGRVSGRDVALKLIKTSEDPRRTAREIEAVARLASSYVPRVHDHGVKRVGPHDQLYIVEDFIEGQTLREHLVSRDGVSNEFARGLGRALLSACVDFEASRLVHRDIKPENIIVDSSGAFWVIDFGIVRFLDRESLTATGNRIGPCTIGYGAPEQLRNEKAEIDARADLFSIGVVLHEVLAGQHPYDIFNVGALEAMKRTLRDDLPVLSGGGIGPGLAELVSVLAARYPSRRPSSAVEALAWFDSIGADEDSAT